MPINGVQTAIFGVDDIPKLCDKFFTDFGLKVASNGRTMSSLIVCPRGRLSGEEIRRSVVATGLQPRTRH